MKTATKPIWTALIGLALAWFALSPAAQAQLPPPVPDGHYPGNNTAEGIFALFSDNVATGINNTALGARALQTNTVGRFNTATGSLALQNNQSGAVNTATGYNALSSNTTGTSNTATGANALFSNTGATADNRLSGSNNTANGTDALYHNISGHDNTATGFNALFSNTGAAANDVFAGNQNTANGSGALFHNNGSGNTATGFNALFNNTNGEGNTATGAGALSNNKGPGADQHSRAGTGNTAMGVSALNGNEYGFDNTAIGASALVSNSSGDANTACGAQALLSGGEGGGNTAVGAYALENSTGCCNIALGVGAGQNLNAFSDNNIEIGNAGVAGESGHIRIGTVGTQTAAFIAGIYNVNEGGTIKPVYINSNGQLGTQPPASSRRFKKEIRPMDQTSEAILGLKPVTFQYRDDSTGTPQFGLIAEEVAKANPDLVVRDDNGEIYTVRYEAVNAMLLNEFLKEHQKVETLESTVAMQEKDFKATIAQQQKQIENLTAGLQRVSDEVELAKPVSKAVASN